MDDPNPEATVLTHEEIFNGVIVRLHRDTILQPSGRLAIREVIHHPGGVCAVPLLGEDGIVLVRQFRYPLKRYILELPAGKLDSDLSHDATIAQELEEETGYRAGELSYECSFYTTPGISDEIVHLYTARGLVAVPQRLDEGEHLTIEIHTLDACLEMIGRGEIRDAKTILGLLWHGARQRREDPRAIATRAGGAAPEAPRVEKR